MTGTINFILIGARNHTACDVKAHTSWVQLILHKTVEISYLTLLILLPMVAQFTVALTLLEHSRSYFELYSVCEKMKAQPKIDMKEREQSLFLAYYPGNRKV